MTAQSTKEFDAVTGANATSKDAVARLVKAWESKNAQRAVRGSGLGLMAVSLAACGGSGDSAPVAPVVPTPPAPPAPQLSAMQAAAANLNDGLGANEARWVAAHEGVEANEALLDLAGTTSDVTNGDFDLIKEAVVTAGVEATDFMGLAVLGGTAVVINDPTFDEIRLALVDGYSRGDFDFLVELFAAGSVADGVADAAQLADLDDALTLARLTAQTNVATAEAAVGDADIVAAADAVVAAALAVNNSDLAITSAGYLELQEAYAAAVVDLLSEMDSAFAAYVTGIANDALQTRALIDDVIDVAFDPITAKLVGGEVADITDGSNGINFYTADNFDNNGAPIPDGTPDNAAPAGVAAVDTYIGEKATLEQLISDIADLQLVLDAAETFASAFESWTTLGIEEARIEDAFNVDVRDVTFEGAIGMTGADDVALFRPGDDGGNVTIADFGTDGTDMLIIDGAYRLIEVDSTQDGPFGSSSALEIFYEEDANGLTLWVEREAADGSASNPFANVVQIVLEDVAFDDLSVLVAGGVTVLTSEAAAIV